ncbi:hypothetical protein RU639_001321 [Aspergillus parasiticus]
MGVWNARVERAVAPGQTNTAGFSPVLRQVNEELDYEEAAGRAVQTASVWASTASQNAGPISAVQKCHCDKNPIYKNTATLPSRRSPLLSAWHFEGRRLTDNNQQNSNLLKGVGLPARLPDLRPTIAS